MKQSILLLGFALLVAGPAFSHENASRQIKSDVPFIIVYGRFVYPDHGVYTVTLTDSTVVVNGAIYVPPEKPDVPWAAPDRKRSFLDWVVRHPADSAQAIIESGGTKEEARKFIDEFYAQFADSSALTVEFDNDLYRIKYRGKEVAFGLPSQKREPKPDYWENTLEPEFNTLLHYLPAGDLIIKGKGYRLIIPANELSPSLMGQLKAIPKKAVKNAAGDFEPLSLDGKCGEIRLGPSAVADLVKASQ